MTSYVLEQEEIKELILLVFLMWSRYILLEQHENDVSNKYFTRSGFEFLHNYF